jgi:glutathione synthase/RimK-type ligase-like ATP-grasp enzyme
LEDEMTRRVYFDANNFKASSPLRLVYALEDRGIFSRVIYPVGRSKLLSRASDLVINWGNPPVRAFHPHTPEVLNKRDNIMLAVDKLDAFKKFKEAKVRIPKFTENYDEANSWSEDHAVIGRSLLRSFQGRGIVFTDKGQAPARVDSRGRSCILWTRYVPKKQEWRVHVFNGKAIGIALKKRRSGVEVDSKIRSWDNGWVYATHDLDPPEGLSEIGVAAVAALGLQMGAVDVIWNQKKNRLYCLEVNTAAGLEGHTVQVYADAIADYVRQTS